jgi:hypothetical protein
VLIALGLAWGVLAVLPVGTLARASPSFTIVLSATPSPSDPLEVTFTATAITGDPTAYAWNFGDGQTFNGTGPGYASPVHRYAHAGTYTIVVDLYEGTLQGTQSITLAVDAAPLHVQVLVANGSGPAPRTVTFLAEVTGGTGTYRSIVWSFGDGGSGVGTSLEYSYVRAGVYRPSVNVTDSAGARSEARAWVNVTDPAPNAPAGAPGTVPTAEVAALAGAAAVGGALAVLAVSHRRGGRHGGGAVGEEAPAAGSLGPPLGAPPEVGGAPGPPATPPAPPMPAVPGLEATGSIPAAIASPAGSPPIAPERPPRAVLAPGTLRLSQRIVLHLAGQGHLGPTEVVPLGFSQIGMSRALGVRQNGLTNVLRRLVAAGVLTEEMRHVHGQGRRLKVYRLTPRGEELARDLRRAPGTGDPARSPASPGAVPPEDPPPDASP